jgi:hypothetical protein
MQTSVRHPSWSFDASSATNSPPNETNQMYTLTISNVFGMEAWNSYSNAYPRPLQVRVFMDMFASLWETNEANVGKLMSSNLVQRLTPTPFINMAASNWSGSCASGWPPPTASR